MRALAAKLSGNQHSFTDIWVLCILPQHITFATVKL